MAVQPVHDHAAPGPQADERLEGPLVLSRAVTVFPAAQLAAGMQDRIQTSPGDFVLTKRGSRSRSTVLNPDSAALLREFSKPTTIVDAVLRFAEANERDAEATLEEAFPLLQRFVGSDVLVPPGEAGEDKLSPLLANGLCIDGYVVVEPVQILEDSEVYRVELQETAEGEDGRREGALKILRPHDHRKNGHAHTHAHPDRRIQREVQVLRKLAGRVAPGLLAAGTHQDRPYVIAQWCEGTVGERQASALRRSGRLARTSLFDLCAAVVDAYVDLHRRGVIHGDVHPRNLIVAPDGEVRLIDFGYARMMRGARWLREAPRAGVPFFYEPEWARRVLSSGKAPFASKRGEQFAVAALLYYLVTGWHYADFVAERREMLTQIVSVPPRPFPLPPHRSLARARVGAGTGAGEGPRGPLW